MENSVEVFKNPEFGELRTIVKDGEPWFVAADVCRALELGTTAKAIERLDTDEKGMNSIHTLGGNQNMTIVSESGLYSLVLGSRKPQAHAFKRWVTHDVIPSIRKTGAYSLRKYPTKSTSLGEVASFLKVSRQIMKENKQSPEKIAEMEQTVCGQFGVQLPDKFVKKSPFEQASLFNLTANIFLPPSKGKHNA